MLEVEELEVLLEASVFRVPMQIFMLWGHRDPVMGLEAKGQIICTTIDIRIGHNTIHPSIH